MTKSYVIREGGSGRAGDFSVAPIGCHPSDVRGIPPAWNRSAAAHPLVSFVVTILFGWRMMGGLRCSNKHQLVIYFEPSNQSCATVSTTLPATCPFSDSPSFAVIHHRGLGSSPLPLRAVTNNELAASFAIHTGDIRRVIRSPCREPVS